MLKLLPVVKPAFKMFPVILEEMGYGDLVIRRKMGAGISSISGGGE